MKRFTEQQIQMMALYNETIRDMYNQVCKERIEEDMRKHEEEIKAYIMQTPEEAIIAAIEYLVDNISIK